MVIPHYWPGRALALGLLALALNAASIAAPYIPANGSQVVERLPSRADPVQRELLRLRAELSKNPNSLPLASALARRYIERARTEGDPRYLGYAQAALVPWWKLPQAPDEVLVCAQRCARAPTSSRPRWPISTPCCGATPVTCRPG